jgi:DDE domain
MSSYSWLSVALSSPMRRCGAGARNSLRVSPTACAAAGHAQETSGTWTRSSSGSRACNTMSGAPWIKMALCSTSSFRPDATAKVAKRFFRRLLKGLQYVPRVIVTDKLRSYGVAQRQLLPRVEHRQSRYLNNRAENSHRPTRRRERQMQRFKSSQQAQEFLSAHSFLYGHFHPRRHQLRVRGEINESSGPEQSTNRIANSLGATPDEAASLAG